jgi:hypothetical protein
MPVVDLAALVNLYYSSTPVLVGGINTKSPGRFFLGDGLHPSTLIQGLVANAFIAAANDAFGTDFTPLSAAEILMNAGISPPNPLGDTFDVTTLVKLPPAMMLPGDYNRDGTVDAADYVMWRHGLGTTYTQGDYDVWRANFGQTIGSGGALPSADPLPIASADSLPAVPEPSTPLVVFVGSLALAARCRPTHVRRLRVSVTPVGNLCRRSGSRRDH